MMRSELSDKHLWAAQFFASEATSVEQADVGRLGEEPYQRLHAYVIASVLGSAAYLEAKINEVFSDAASIGSASSLPAARPAHRRLLGSIWSREIRALGTLQKYELALRVGERPLMEQGRRPASDAKLLFRQRNDLLHYEPEWVNVSRRDGRALAQEEQHRLEKAFGHKFEPNALASRDGDYAYWPERCLGAGCAAWGLSTAQEFVAEFNRRMDPSIGPSSAPSR